MNRRDAQENEDVPLLSDDNNGNRKKLANVSGKDTLKMLGEILKDKEVVISSVLYALLGFLVIIYDEVFSIWAGKKILMFDSCANSPDK